MPDRVDRWQPQRHRARGADGSPKPHTAPGVGVWSALPPAQSPTGLVREFS